MVAFSTWEPSEEDMEFTRQLIRIFTEGGRWVWKQIPFQVYRLYASRKEIVLEKGDPNHPTHARTIICFNRLGWKMTHRV